MCFRLVLIFQFLLITSGLRAQSDTTKTQDNGIYSEDHVYMKNIKTVQLTDSGNTFFYPSILLGSNQQLYLSFDDLGDDLKKFNYRITYCNAEWKPTLLSPFYYTSGFDHSEITTYKKSVATSQHYIHYNLAFPDKYSIFNKSGNYILTVYQDNDTSKPVFSKRFLIYDQKIKIEAVVTASTEMQFKNYKQKINFSIDHTDYEIKDPYSDLKIVITQNGRWDNAASNLKPSLANDNVITYNSEMDAVFNGGNEFRLLDLTKETGHKKQSNPLLIQDENRSFKRYAFSKDLNGKYIVKSIKNSHDQTEADYVYVHFFLPCEQIPDGGLYIFGALSHWQYIPDCKMKYNSNLKGYENTLYLKQGLYNYQYVYLKNTETSGDETEIEGMHAETENDYTIYVYFQQAGTNYDQLIGIKQINSLTH